MNETTIAGVESQLHDLFSTRAMPHSRERVPDLLAEAADFRELSEALADDPLLALRRLLEIARRSSHAGSAGVSLLRHDAEGQEVICWEVLNGMLASYEGAHISRDSTPCGLCLSAETTVLLSRRERAYSDLHNTHPPIIEDLVVPLYNTAKKPVGTLWVAHHDYTSHFCSDDARIMEHLAVQAVLALELLEHARERQHTLVLLESHQRAQRELLAHDVHRERSLREHAEACERKARRALARKEIAIQEAHHRVKNTMQIAASVLSLHARATDSEQVRMALHESHARLQVLAKVHELLYTSVSTAPFVLMPPLLDSLGEALRQSFAEMSARVTLQISADAVRLPADEAIALALLANEAVTNAYKHAFPNDSAGTISVALRVPPDNRPSLRITDDGVGLSTSRMSGGIGLKLVRALAKQSGGVLNISTAAESRGTEITITLRPAARRSRRRTDPVRVGTEAPVTPRNPH